MRNRFISGVVLSLLALPLPARALNSLIPANAEEIMYALGPDGKGLRIIDDELPDLFSLTASRLEEDAKLFTVEQPYTAGRWAGGRAVIEYARDLSYTQVSIFDKNGKRQRIYSVRSRLEERREPRDFETVKTTREQPSASEPPPSDKPRRRAVPASDKVVVSGSDAEPQYEWDEARGEYVPLKGAVAVASVPTPKPVVSAVQTPPPPVVVPVPVVPAVPEKRSAKQEKPSRPSKPAAPAVAAGSAPEFVWDEAQGTYVQKGGTPAKTVAVAKAGKSAPAAAPTSPTAPPEPVDLHPAPEIVERWGPLTDFEKKQAKGSSRKSAQEPTPVAAVPPAAPIDTHVPTTEELLAADMPTEKPVSPPPPAKPTGVSNVKLPRNKKAGAAQTISGESTMVESTEAYDLPADDGKPRRKGTAATSGAVAPTPAAVAEIPPELAAAQKALAAEEAAKAAAPALPETLASDAWVPKKTTVKPVVEDIPEVQTVAMLPKTPVSNAPEDLIKIHGEGQMPNESDKWVPRAAKVQVPDADINDQIKRAQNIKTPKPNYVPPPVRKDVNNPEEGVLPVSSFEKFSGGRYGRHREYERRFFPGKKNKGLLDPKEYDFYVDEVDRKKEFHNIYYYKTAGKGQPPKLVAVQKHDNVSFLSNYDVDKEDKGKLKRY